MELAGCTPCIMGRPILWDQHELFSPAGGWAEETARRVTMTGGAIIMMLIGLGVTWGGAAVCLSVAMKKRDI
jgi:hypothetical protein